MPLITITRNASGWSADFGHADEAIRRPIMDAFDGYVLPLPFTADAGYDTVEASVRRCNPGHEVRPLTAADRAYPTYRDQLRADRAERHARHRRRY